MDREVVSGKPFPKGISGNPGGRPKGLERQVRAIVGDDIVAMTKAQVQIALGKSPDGIELKGGVTARDMTNAYNAVVDRGWGKARATVDLTGDANPNRVRIDYDKLTDDELQKLIEAENIALAAGLEESDDEDEDAPSSDDGELAEAPGDDPSAAS